MNTNTISYGSVCSGIEAASVAWEVLGFSPAWFSQFDPEHKYNNGPDFPSAVLAHHWPEVPNLGDMTKLAAKMRAGEMDAPDILVGGTPCQAFSVAGARAGLSDPRGQLTISYGELADAIDDRRAAAGLPPAIIVWENVPGVLSSKDNAFGAFLGLLAGEDCELQPPGKRWANAGCVLRGKRAIAWRILDAQYFGVAQRRRRVFVVASARKGFDPAEVLFEFDSMRRDSAPRRETQKAVADLTARGVGTCGADDNQAQAGHLIAFGGGNTAGHIDVATACTAHGIRLDFDTETFAVHGTQDPDTNCELARNNGQENACIAFSYKDSGADATSDLSPTIRAGNHDKSHANSGQPPAIAMTYTAPAIGHFKADNISSTLTKSAGQGNGETQNGAFVLKNMAVRRLTPVECERLQGFPDNHTLIPTEKRKQITAEEYVYLRHHFPNMTAEEAYRLAADGPRYKAIGNSMAVPVMRWIGERIMKAISEASHD